MRNFAHLLLLGALLASVPGLSAAERLNVFIWSEYLDPGVVRDFEGEFDAQVTIDVYEDAESMMAKLQAGGSRLYDVVVPPDHMVVPMVKLGLLRKLRHENLPNLRHLDPRFLRRPFDAANEHTVPYQWGTVGIYYRKHPERPAPDSWGVVFDPAKSLGPFVLIDSMRDTIGAALTHLGHGFNTTDPAALRKARDLLIATKDRCLAIEGSVGGLNRVLAGSAKAAIVYSGEAARGIRQDPGTAYFIPKEGGQIWLDNLAIPSGSPNPRLAERFINHLMEPGVAARNASHTLFATANRAALPLLDEKVREDTTIHPPAEVLDRLEYLEDLGARNRLFDQIWTRVKAR